MNFNANIVFIQFFIIKRLLKIERKLKCFSLFKKLRINREEIDEFNSKINLYL